MKQELETITARQLREILFHVDDQDLTVKELRKLLFDAPEQDKPVSIGFSMFVKMLADKQREAA